jgi:hypothetical protein
MMRLTFSVNRYRVDFMGDASNTHLHASHNLLQASAEHYVPLLLIPE